MWGVSSQSPLVPGKVWAGAGVQEHLGRHKRSALFLLLYQWNVWLSWRDEKLSLLSVFLPRTSPSPQPMCRVPPSCWESLVQTPPVLHGLLCLAKEWRTGVSHTPQRSWHPPCLAGDGSGEDGAGIVAWYNECNLNSPFSVPFQWEAIWIFFFQNNVLTRALHISSVLSGYCF